MTTSLKIELHPDWNCWIAYSGDRAENSVIVGEGTTHETAIADYWAGVHGYDTSARLITPDWSDDGLWALYDGKNIVRFDSREEAVAYGEANEYLIKL